MRVHLIKRGACYAKGWTLERGLGQQKILVPAFILYIEDEINGDSLVDTGYGEAFFQATTKFPGILMRKITPVILESETFAEQLTKILGRIPTPKRLIITHFHPDHIGGLSDALACFPTITTIYGSQKELSHYQQKNCFSQIKSAFLEELLPTAITIQDIGSFQQVSLPLKQAISGYDILGNSSILLIPLGGHSYDQVGVFLPEKLIFYLADATYTEKNLKYRVKLPTVMGMIADDKKMMLQTYHRLTEIYHEDTNISYLTAHDFYRKEQHYVF